MSSDDFVSNARIAEDIFTHAFPHIAHVFNVTAKKLALPRRTLNCLFGVQGENADVITLPQTEARKAVEKTYPFMLSTYDAAVAKGNATIIYLIFDLWWIIPVSEAAFDSVSEVKMPRASRRGQA